MEQNNQLTAVVVSLIINHRTQLHQLLRESERNTWKLIHRRRREFAERRKASFNILIENLRSFGLFGVSRSLSSMPIAFRCIGSKYRIRIWWHHVVLKTFDVGQWFESFRMNKETFYSLVEILRNELEESPDCPIPGLTVEEKVGIGVYRLASVCEYRSVGNCFGTHKSTNCEWVHKFVRAVNKVMLKDYLHLPTSKEECEVIATEFEDRYGVPQVVGAIDGSYIAVTAPAVGGADFRCRKGYTAIIIQAVVDHRICFRDVTIKHPGSNHDATVLVDSYLYQNIHRLLPKSDRVYDGHTLPFVILGDPAYPLLPWLMKNYGSARITAEQKLFNKSMNAARCVVEQAFGRLKSRWRILSRKNDLDVYFVPEVVLTCCILHNFVEKAKESFPNHWMLVSENEELPPHQHSDINNMRDRRAAIRIRDHMAAYIAANRPRLEIV